ncbi:LPXTG cell wall anchor domain-containing protein [Enterococcus hirae]|nr:LPXTG cell wall anchor domain-containing protein [Enterococcus hirae]EMF0622985.1 LPXTG cell wall anchor domain-containing protein [Enterococcus hirae]
MKFNKIKKKMTFLMLFLSLSGVISPPLSVLAETKIDYPVQNEEVVQEEPSEQITDDSIQDTNQVVEEVKDIGETTVSSDYKQSEQMEPEDKEESKSETIQSNQSLVPVPPKSEEQINQEIKELFEKNGYEVLSKGIIRSTTGTSYRSSLLDLLAEVEEIKAQNQRQARAALRHYSFAAINTGVVYVDSNYGDKYFKWSQSNGNEETGYYAKKDSSGTMLWCVEPGAPLDWGANSGYTISNVTKVQYIKASLAVYWGWEKQKSIVNAFYTEKLVQEITTGVTTFNIVDLSGKGRISQSGYEAFKKATLAKVDTFYKRPSFDGKTYTVKLGETLTLTDSNNVLNYYKLMTNNVNVSVSINGNTLKLTPSNNSMESGKLEFKYNIDNSYLGATILYQAPWLQDVIKAKIGDPAKSTVNLKVQKNGNAKIKKIDADTGAAISGAKFRLSYGGKQVEVVTNANGEADLKDVEDGTKVTIQEIQSANGYVLNKTPQTVTIEADKTVTATFKNKKQVGTIIIDKSGAEFKKDMPNTNYMLKGNEFAVYEGEKTAGTPVGTITTDESGIAKITDLPLGKYTIKETKASNGFILNTNIWTVELTYAGQNVAVTTTDQKVVNQEQKGSVVLTKQDSETGSTPQGDTTFADAEFDLFRKSDNKKIGHYTTNDKGQLTVNNLLIDTYYFTETKAPIGYILDKTPVEFSIEYAGQTANVAKQATATKKNSVMTGGFDLIKTANYNWYTTAWNWLTGKDTSDQPTVLEDVEFTVTQDFGKKEVVRKALTDEQGYVSFDKLPYGTYVVSETKTPTGYKGISDFKVTISEDGQRFHYVVENKVKEAKVKFVKVDAETGKTIVRSNAGFEIYSKTTGEQLVMQDLQGKEQSVFYTDKNGILQLPTQFAIGKYFAKEVKAPEGYVLAKDTIDFEVTGEEKDGLVVVTIKNDNQKGQVTLHKTVQTAMSVETKDSEYGSYSEIQFNQGNGEGFSFKIRPTEDIVTADGTIRFKAGEFLQKDGEDQVWTTDSEGNFQTEPFLYIGKYEAVEVKAPAGVNLQDVTPIPFEITYAGQNIAITSTTATAENYLQEINIYGHKQQEVITGWEDGKAVVELENANNGQVFALRTGQDLQIGDTILKAGTTLGYAVVNDGVFSFENMLLPNVKADYYLQEVDAGSDHVLNEEQYFFTYTPVTNDREHEIHVWADSFAENKQALTRIARNPILNKLARATVKLVKTDDLDGQALENVAFDLVRIDSMIDENGEETTTETVISKHATNAAGEIVVENLPTGNYKFVESRPLDWYEDNTDDLSFTVTPKEDGSVIEVSAVNFRKPLEITTKFATTKDGHKQANPDIDNELTDYVSVDGMKPGHTYFVDTAYVNRDTKEVVSTSTSEITTDKEGTFEFTTELSLPKGTLKDSTRLTATHVIYEDKEKTKEIGRHDDLENDDQTVIFKSPKVSIHTKAHTGDNKTQTFTHGELINAYDNVDLSHENVLNGTERAFEAILVAQTPDGKMTDIWTSGKIDYVVNDSTIVKQVKTKVDTSKYPEGTTFFFKEVGYNEAGEKDCEHNFDGKDKEQALTPVKKGTLPKTGSNNEIIWVIIGIVFVLAASMIMYQISRKED